MHHADSRWCTLWCAPACPVTCRNSPDAPRAPHFSEYTALHNTSPCGPPDKPAAACPGPVNLMPGPLKSDAGIARVDLGRCRGRKPVTSVHGPAHLALRLLNV